MKNVVIYARYSSSKQNDTSIEAQLAECYEYCKRNKYKVIGEYIDKALTGRNDDRPEFQRMIEDGKSKAFNAIVVYQLDRFARNRYDSAVYKSELKKNNIKVLSAKENITEDASGIIVEGVMEAIAEYYSAELSQKVKRNLKMNAEKGLFNGGYPPFGYKVEEVNYDTYTKKKLAIDTDTAPVVKEIFNMRANDVKILDIVDYLNSKGYKTVMGKEFKKNSLQTILTNKRYIGTNIYNDLEFPNTIPAIIDEDLFYRVQEIVNKHKYAPATYKATEEYILTTKLFCGKCKEMMTGTCGKSQTGRVYRYYQCNGIKKHKCKTKNVPKDYIEDLVVNYCRSILTDNNINIIAKETYKINHEDNSQTSLIKSLQKQIDKNEKGIEQLLKAIEQGINTPKVGERINQLQKDLDEARLNLAREQHKLINLSIDEIKFFLLQLKNGDINDMVYRKLLINLFVNRVYLYDTHLTIVFNIAAESIEVEYDLVNDIEKNIFNQKGSVLNIIGQPIYSKLFSLLIFVFAKFTDSLWFSSI